MLSIGMDRARLGKAIFRGICAVRPRNALKSGGLRNRPVPSSKCLSTRSVYRGSKPATISVAKPLTMRTARSFSVVPKGPQQVETVFERQVREAKSDFKTFMTRERRPLRFAGLNTTTTIGMMCGHASFGIAALVYLETDVMTVRWLVLGGSSLGLLFSYYRHPPLLISLKWLTLTLILNTVLLIVLSNERAEAEELAKDPEKARIFQELFVAFDLTPLDFLRLMDLAQRRVWLKGNDINQEGRPYETMHLIVEGGAEVKSQGETVSHLKPGGFIGSLAFNRFIQEPVDVESKSTIAATAADHGMGIFQAEFVYVESSILEDGSSVYGDGDGRSTRQIVKGAFLHLMRQDHIIGKVAKSLVSDVMGMRVHVDEMERCKTTVTATSDVVTYGWDMHALRAFIKRRPLIGASLQKAMAEDFINKVYQARGHEERYRLLLVESLDPGSINPIGMEKLRRYREMHGISEEVHHGFLVEQGWTEDEFRAGFRNTKAPRDGSKRFLEYEALVARELGKGKVQPETRSILRSFRSQAGIDAQEHLLAIQKQGWSADDYEVGDKGKGKAAADLDQSSNTADQ